MKYFLFFLAISLLLLTSCHENISNDVIINPGNPTNLSAQGISTRKVKLLWTTTTNANGYKVERKTQGNFTIIATVGLQNNFIDSTVSENTQYTYRVFSYNGTISSNYTNEATIYTGSSNSPNLNDTVRVCSQTWMTKNLDVAYYRNGDPIPQIIDPIQWSSLTTGAWCYYNNDAANGAIYGKLYNWYAVNDPRGLAPVGWHIPSSPEYISLINCLSGATVAGGKMKETGTTHWLSPNAGATNSSGFTGLPGGFRGINGSTQTELFQSLGSDGAWYNSTSYLDNSNGLMVGSISLSNNSSRISEGFTGSNVSAYYNNAYSVRCLLGLENSISIITNLHSNLTATSVESGGYISNDGGYTITARGVIWSTSPFPSVNLNTKTINGTGMGSFVSSINGLSPNTVYYIRAYATNLTGTSYGNQDTINTINYTIPTIVTKPITLITHNTCVSGATSINNGNNPIISKGVVWSTLPNPTISLSTKTYDGSGSALFNSSIIGLSRNTRYYVRAYATNSAGTGYGNEIIINTVNIESVAICDQVWTTKNLDLITYRNGDPIPQISDSTAWQNATTGAWCYYNNDPTTGAVYGKLYNWYAVNDPRGLAPVGWHIPSGNEWNNLIFCVANNTTSCTSSGTAIHNTVNSKLQSTGTIESGTGLWHASSWYVANNSSGFTALPLPKRYSGAGPGGFQQTAWGYYASFWTSTIDPNFPLYLSQEINMGTSSQSVCVGGTSKSEGNSIRCIKD